MKDYFLYSKPYYLRKNGKGKADEDRSSCTVKIEDIRKKTWLVLNNCYPTQITRVQFRT